MRTGRRLDKRQYLLISLARSTDDRRLCYCGMGIQNCLNLSGIDVEAKSDDEILRASDNEEIPVLKAGKIAGVEPSLRIDRGRRLFGRAVIAFHDVGPAHP